MNGAVSHELRNPLSSLLAGIDLMNSYISNLKDLIVCLDHLDEDIIRASKSKIKNLEWTNLESTDYKSEIKMLE